MVRGEPAQYAQNWVAATLREIEGNEHVLLSPHRRNTIAVDGRRLIELEVHVGGAKDIRAFPRQVEEGVGTNLFVGGIKTNQIALLGRDRPVDDRRVGDIFLCALTE